MRKVFLITTALVWFGITPVEAAPAVAIVAGALGGGAIATMVATAVVYFGASAVLGAVQRKLYKNKATGADQQVQRAELARPTALPPYRFVYGWCWAPGSPVGWRVTGRILWVCYLLNSRPSAMSSHTLLIDKRRAESSGDPFNFNGGGATLVNAPFNSWGKYWLGRGDQTQCPREVVEGAGGEFVHSDAWRGRTVMWARFDCGPDDTFRERWISTPPEINVESNWSIIHDPRSDSYGAHNNQALVVLDALRNNPLRRYADEYIWLDTFRWAANIADQQIQTKSGAPIQRYRADGVLVWSEGTELEDQIGPLLDAGGARLSRIGGRLGIIPACDRPPVHTISEFSDGQAVEMRRWQSSDHIYTEGVASYTAPDRSYEEAEAPVYIVAGAQAEDGGLSKRLDLKLGFVVDWRQAQRLTKIAVMRARMQREISAELWPDAFTLVAGSIATVALADHWAVWNGRYEVSSINPAAALNDDQSICLRLPAVLREDHPAIYAWDCWTEEGDVIAAPPIPAVGRIQPPASVSLASGGDAAIISGGHVTPRVQADWPASGSASVYAYEWHYRRGAGSWIEGGSVGNGVGALRAWITPAEIDLSYQIRVRAIGRYGQSDWIESLPIVASGPTGTLATPEILMAIGGAGMVDLTMRQADDGAAAQIEIWAGEVDDIEDAVLLATISASANVTATHSHTGLDAETEYFYWVRARNGFGAASAFSAMTMATTLE